MVSLASSYFYTSRERPGDNSSYQKYSGKNPLQSYENLIAPVHLPTEEHWLPVMISIIDVCIYIYKSTYFSADIHHTVLKQIYQERQNLPQEQSTLLNGDNWKVNIASCLKQSNSMDCGVFTYSFTKQFISKNCNSYVKHTTDFLNVMVGDLLDQLACSNSRSSQRPKDFNWLMDDAVRSESEGKTGRRSGKCRPELP